MSNKKFMCILRSQSGSCEESSPSEMEVMFAKYQQWQNKFSENIADMGNKLGEKGSVVTQGGVSDGPFVEIKEIIGGYMMLQTSNLEEAIEVIKQSPMVEDPNVSIEIREVESH